MPRDALLKAMDVYGIYLHLIAHNERRSKHESKRYTGSQKNIRKRIFKVILCIFLAALVALGGILLSLQLSPRAFVGFLRHSGAFTGKSYIPSFIADKADMVSVIQNISYPSNYESNTLDIYYPSNASAVKATVFWMHGG